MDATKLTVSVFKAIGIPSNIKKKCKQFYIEIKFGRQKFVTSAREEHDSIIEWNETCDFPVNDSIHDVFLTVYRQSDKEDSGEFYGKVRIQKNVFKTLENVKNVWYNIEGRFSQKKLGSVEVNISFDVLFNRGMNHENSHVNATFMTMRPFLPSRSLFTGSLISIDTFEKSHSKLPNFKKFTSKFKSKHKKEHVEDNSPVNDHKRVFDDDDDSFKFDSLTSSRNSLNPFEIPEDNEKVTTKHCFSNNNDVEIGANIVTKANDAFKEDLVFRVKELEKTIQKKNEKIQDLENYIDNLLLHVMETTPKLLQKNDSFV